MGAKVKKLVKQSRKMWSAKDTKALLGLLIEMQKQDFDPNDNNCWAIETNAELIVKKLQIQNS